VNISDVLEQQACLLKDVPCIRFTNSYWSFDYLNLCVWRIASLLHSKGVVKGDVLALTFKNELLLLVTMMATARIGATVFSVPLNTPSVRKRKMLKQVNARYLTTDLVDLQYADLESIRIGLETLDQSKNSIEKNCKDDRPTAPWILVAGSGSTGNPKLMAITHRQQLFRMKAGLEWLPYSSDDILFSLIDLNFYGAKQRYLEAFTRGSSIALVDRKHMEIGNAVKNQKITVVYATVFHIERILRSLPSGSRSYLASLTALMLGGSTVSMNLRNSICDKLCSNLYVLYGANECHTTCCTQIPEVYEVQGSVGHPHKGFKLQIVDEGDSPLPISRVGQVRIRSEAMIDGYFKDEVATANAFKHGWFYPGDLGKLTADGQLIHMGRIDDMMIMNGINIYPAEIEQTMYSHPDVVDTVVLSMKHSVHQDIPVCAVTLKEDAQVSEQDLIIFARNRLAAHSPKRLVVLDKIPRNQQGKPIRNELNTLIASKLSADAGRVDTMSDATRVNSLRKTGQQLTWKIAFSRVLPDQPDLAVLDDWLTQVVLESDPDDESREIYPRYDNLPVVTGRWLWRCLQLSRFILQAARVPIFDTPEVIACRLESQNSQKWNITVALTLIEDLPRELYGTAIGTAFTLAESVLTQKPTATNLESFFETIEERILAPYSGVLTRGKSTLPVLEVAYRKEIPFRHVGDGVFQLGWGARARFIDRSTTEVDSVMGSKLSQSKLLTARLLRSAGLPSPVHQAVKNLDDALALAQRLEWPVVVKPSDRDRGVGVTVDVTDQAKLRTAFELASKLSRSKQVIVEKQVDGVCHRFFLSNGKLLYAVKRLPMSVTGNGKQTVAELVTSEAEAQQRVAPWKRSKIIPLDPPALAAIDAAGFSESSVPDKGTRVPLRRIESTEWGGIDEDVTNRIHPENLRIALAAARLFRLNVAGVDIISRDISMPWYENDAIINEVNFAPLLGGGEISRRHIPDFLDQYIAGNGRIPVEVFVGGESAWQAASQRRQTFVNQGVNAYVTNGIETLDSSRKKFYMPITGLFQRARALVLLSEVEAIILVVQTDEFLYTGLPLEFVDDITHVDGHMVSFKSRKGLLSPDRTRLLVHLLEKWKPV